MADQNAQKYLNITDLEASSIQRGNLMQLMRRAKLVDARRVEQVQAEFDAFGAVGSVLYARESWRVSQVDTVNGYVSVDYRSGSTIQWSVGDEAMKYKSLVAEPKWQPAHSMPKFAVRTVIEIQELFVHRLLDLKEVDARLLGVEPRVVDWDTSWRDYEFCTFAGVPSAKDSYMSWYCYTYGTTNFRSNDWQIRAVIKVKSLSPVSE